MNKLYTQISAGAGAVLSAFVIESIAAMMPWLVTISALIIADLCAGVAKRVKWKERLSFSKGIRDSLLKFVAYYSIIVCFSMIEMAAECPGLTTKVCWVIVVAEGTSIFSNVLKFHGYTVDVRRLVAMIASRKWGGSREDYETLITKDKETKE